VARTPFSTLRSSSSKIISILCSTHNATALHNTVCGERTTRTTRWLRRSKTWQPTRHL